MEGFECEQEGFEVYPVFYFSAAVKEMEGRRRALFLIWKKAVLVMYVQVLIDGDTGPLPSWIRAENIERNTLITLLG